MDRMNKCLEIKREVYGEIFIFYHRCLDEVNTFVLQRNILC